MQTHAKGLVKKEQGIPLKKHSFTTLERHDKIPDTLCSFLMSANALKTLEQTAGNLPLLMTRSNFRFNRPVESTFGGSRSEIQQGELSLQ